MRRRTLLLTSVILVFFIPDSKAQSATPSTLNAAGGSGTIGSDTWEWSVGEMTLVNTATSTNVVVTQGLLQPSDETVGIKDVALNRHLAVYPNPSSHIVNLEYNFPAAGKLSYVLQDVTGKRISGDSREIKPGKDALQVNLAPLANATYMLFVTFQGTGQSLQQTSFKIDKIN